jgi:glycine oxidase
LIVVGGGIIGLACAWRLAQRGVKVEIFDSGRLAGEASWAGAGMLAPGGEYQAGSPLTAMALASLAAWPEFAAELGVEIRHEGAIETAFSDEEAAALTERAARQAAGGIPSQGTSWPGCVAARFYPNDAVVDPREVTAALRAACERLGVGFHEHQTVQSIEPFVDEGVIVAAGAWSSQLLPNQPRSYPVRGHLLGWDAKPGTLKTILRNGPTYLLQRLNGRIIAGSSSERVGFDRAIDPAVVEDLRQRAIRLFPALADLPVAEVWNGFRPAIEGEVPSIGRVPGTNIWTAYGHYRNGILLAPITAQMIASEGMPHGNPR